MRALYLGITLILSSCSHTYDDSSTKRWCGSPISLDENFRILESSTIAFVREPYVVEAIDNLKGRPFIRISEEHAKILTGKSHKSWVNYYIVRASVVGSTKESIKDVYEYVDSAHISIFENDNDNSAIVQVTQLWSGPYKYFSIPAVVSSHKSIDEVSVVCRIIE